MKALFFIALAILIVGAPMLIMMAARRHPAGAALDVAKKTGEIAKDAVESVVDLVVRDDDKEEEKRE